MKALVSLLFILFSVNLFAVDEEAIVSYPLDAEIKELPKSCLFSKAPSCLIQTNFHRKYRYKSPQGELALGSESAIIKRNNSEIHFVSGELWWNGSGKLVTEYGTILCASCEAYIYRGKKEIHIRSLSGKVAILPKGMKKPIEVPNFMENWMGGVRVKDGHALSGIPSPIPLRKHLRKWAQFYNGEKIDFKNDVKIFRRKWAEVVHISSAAYKKLSTRRVATVLKKRAEKKAAKKKRLAEDQVFRDMLRRRALTE